MSPNSILYPPRNKNNRLNDRVCFHTPPNLLDISKLKAKNNSYILGYLISLLNLSKSHIKCNFVAFSVDDVVFAEDILPPIHLECGVKKNGHSHLAMQENRDTVRSVFASGEAYFTLSKNRLNLVKITNIAGSFRTSSDEHAQRIQTIFRNKFGNLNGVIYINQAKIYHDNNTSSIEEKKIVLEE